VHLHHLSLTNFRNYTRLELSLPDRLTILQGANAQGKTNLLEAIHLLATGRSPRAAAERDLINWLALAGPLPYARLEGEVGTGRATTKLELVLELVSNGVGSGAGVRKQVRINGMAKRALDLVGRLRVVLFLPEDISLVTGAPAERRRYLDIALCQVAADYCRALADYNRVLNQRNALLRRLRDYGGDPGQLTFWNERLAEHGSLLIWHRSRAISHLDRLAAEHHAALTAGDERLHLVYLPSLLAVLPRSQERSGVDISQPPLLIGGETAQQSLREHFLTQLRDLQPREIAAGTTLLGPHRDDMQFTVDDRDLRAFGSRGQQRTAALALKLAEVQMMQDLTGESPLLLLDDVMSELDARRRQALVEALANVEQALVTTTDWGDFSPELLARARRLQVEQGVITRVE